MLVELHLWGLTDDHSSMDPICTVLLKIARATICLGFVLLGISPPDNFALALGMLEEISSLVEKSTLSPAFILCRPGVLETHSLRFVCDFSADRGKSRLTQVQQGRTSFIVALASRLVCILSSPPLMLNSSASRA